jgi:hypothetical protein
VELSKTSDIEYSGFFLISDSTPSGTAYTIFSGRDVAGNRGTQINSGNSIEIDTIGPSVTRITILPEEPIKNDEAAPVPMTVTIGLNEVIKPGGMPLLSCLLSGEGRTKVAIGNLTEVTPQTGEQQSWQGTFILPADAGLAEVENLQFIYTGKDDLDNESTNIYCDNLFQVYQGELPPLETPQGLQAESLTQGRIKLTWNGVEEAVDYQLYRQAPGETEPTLYQRTGALLEFTDQPSEDGLYYYAVASVRQANGQESLSSMSALFEVYSDSVTSGPPLNLSLELIGSGIKAQWDQPSPYTETVTYSLYRSDTAEITSVEGLTPIAINIAQTMAVDPNPSPLEHCYAVTAVDIAGNESQPSESVYLGSFLDTFRGKYCWIRHLFRS